MFSWLLSLPSEQSGEKPRGNVEETAAFQASRTLRLLRVCARVCSVDLLSISHTVWPLSCPEQILVATYCLLTALCSIYCLWYSPRVYKQADMVLSFTSFEDILAVSAEYSQRYEEFLGPQRRDHGRSLDYLFR
jgi:hypothetical protein